MRPGVVGVNLERGKCRITRWGVMGPHGIVPMLRGLTVTPKGTDVMLIESEQGASVEVVEGAVVVSGGATETPLNAGQRVSLPGGEITSFDAKGVSPSLLNGLPPDLAAMDDRTPQAYGDVAAAFTGDQVGDGWLWEDPDADAKVQTPQPGTLRITVPDGNDLWETRYGAPRLLHKVTGDFDLEGELLLTSRASNWVSADFLVKSPGSYMGARLGQLPLDATGAHYWLAGLCWAHAEGNFRKLNRLNQEAFWQGVDAPDHPIRVRLTRRDSLWKAYWSVDGDSWNVFGIHDVEAPETVFVGWLFRRRAGDLPQEPGVFTLREIRLHSEPPGLAELPAWDTFCLNGGVEAEGPSVRITLDGKGPGEAYAISGGCLTGDFDVAIRYDTGQWEPRRGETRSWFVAAATGDARQRFHIGGLRNDAADPQRLFSHVCTDGKWGAYGTEVSAAKSGRFRLSRKDGIISTFYETPEGWTPLGETGREISHPLHLWLEASNTDKANTHAPFTVVYQIEPVAAAGGGPNNQITGTSGAGTTTVSTAPGTTSSPADATGDGAATPEACVSNLRELALAAAMYAMDWDGKLPDADKWVSQLTKYLADAHVLKCPSAPDLECGYAMNAALSGVVLEKLQSPAETVLFFDSHLGTMNAAGGRDAVCAPGRHGGGNCYAFADGHATWLPEIPDLSAAGAAAPHGPAAPPAATTTKPKPPANPVANPVAKPGQVQQPSTYPDVPQLPVQGANLLTPLQLPTTVSIPTGTKAAAFEAPFALGRPFSGPGGEMFVLSSDRNVGLIAHVRAAGTMFKCCESSVLRGDNWRGAVYRDGRFVVTVDYNPAGGTSNNGVYEVMLDGTSRAWKLQRDYGGLGDIVEASQGGFYVTEFESTDNIYHLASPGTAEKPVVTHNWPGGIMRLAYDRTQRTLYGLNWGRDWFGGSVNGVYRLSGDEMVLVSQAPAGMAYDDLAISPGGGFPAGLYVADCHHGRVLRIVPGDAPVPVVTGLQQPAYIGFVPATGELMIVCESNHLLWVSAAR